MRSSVPAALDYLAARIPELPILGEFKPRPAFSYGWPAARGESLIVLAGTPDDDILPVQQDYTDLSGEEHEDVTVISTIRVRRAGERMMSRAVTDAHAILDAIRDLVNADRSLGKAIVNGLPARVRAVRGSFTRGAKQAGEGRVCELRWTVTWRHRLG